jgi:hypothetical protein
MRVARVRNIAITQQGTQQVVNGLLLEVALAVA